MRLAAFLAWIPLYMLYLLVFTPAPPTVEQTGDGCDLPSAESRFGVIDHLSWRFLYDADAIDRSLSMMNAAGIDWVRLNWSWKDIEPEQGQLNYSQFDLVAQAAAAHDIHLLPLLTAVPLWASTAPEALKQRYGGLAPVDRYRPADPEDWLLYVARAVERYDGDGYEDAPDSPRISHWQIWNEPNLTQFWPPEPDPNAYFELLAPTAEVIRKADPTATIVLGGISGTGVKEDGTGYLQQLYALGAAPYFDVVAVHHYIHPALGTGELLRVTLETTRAMMDAYDDTETPLWLTEIGWSDAPNAWGLRTAAPEEIAAWLTEVYTTPLPVEKIFWYNFRDIAAESDEVEHNFGLIEHDFTPKPAFDAYAAATQVC